VPMPRPDRPCQPIASRLQGVLRRRPAPQLPMNYAPVLAGVESLVHLRRPAEVTCAGEVLLVQPAKAERGRDRGITT
jgi:hypothetical protein